MGFTATASKVPFKYAQAENGIPFNASGSKNHFPFIFSLSSLSPLLIQFLHVFKFCDSKPMAFVQLTLVCAHSETKNR